MVNEINTLEKYLLKGDCDNNNISAFLINFITT